MRKYGRQLKRAHDAAAGDLRGPREGDVPALIEDRALGRSQELGQQVEEGRLAGAVGADQGMDLPATHLQVNLVNGDETAEVLTQASGFEDQILSCEQSSGSHSDAYKTPDPRARV